MNLKTTVPQADDAPKTSLPDRLAPIDIGRMGATRRTPSCQPPGAYLNGLALESLGLPVDLTGLLGEAHAGQ